MPQRWFRLPETGSGTIDDPHEPDPLGYDIDGFSGQRSHPDGAPVFVVRVAADSTTLDNLANEPQATPLDQVPVNALNNMLGQNRTGEEWNNAMHTNPE